MIDAEHDVVIVTAPIWAFADPYADLAPDAARFRAGLPEDYQRLLIGPAISVVNGFLTWIFTSDGHYENWDDDAAEAAALRAEFIALWDVAYPDGMEPFAVVHISYGGKRPPGYRASIEYARV